MELKRKGIMLKINNCFFIVGYKDIDLPKKEMDMCACLYECMHETEREIFKLNTSIECYFLIFSIGIIVSMASF